MKRDIFNPKTCLIAITAFTLLSTNACVRKPVTDMPTVEFSVDWNNATRIDIAKPQNAVINLYPQLPYTGANLQVLITGDNPTNSELLPGPYKLHMYSLPSSSIVAAGGTFDSLTLEVLSDLTFINPIAQVMALDVSSSQRSIIINNKGTTNQKVMLKPVSLSKSLRFTIKGENFGAVESITASVTGIAAKVKVVDFSTSVPKGINIEQWTVADNTYSSEPVEVLGLYTNNTPVMLQLMLKVPNVETPLSQSADITEIIKNLRGDEVEVAVTITYEPEIHITSITVNEWLNGDKLDIDIN